MAGPLIGNRVLESTTTTGTGTINLAGAQLRGITFVAGVGNGNTCFYCISQQGAILDEWEIGLGTVTDASPDTLSRTTIIASSNSGSAVNFSAGTKDVFTVAPVINGLPLIQMLTTFALRRADEASATTTVGNARGNQAVDLQLYRSVATRVASGNYSFIGGGTNNTASGSGSNVVGGFTNTASGTGSFIGAGTNNSASATRTFVGCGSGNTAGQNYNVCVGGYQNNCGGSTYSAICGGSANTVSGGSNFIGGGGNNSTSQGNSVVCGGSRNTASAQYAAVLGGFRAVAGLRGQQAQACGLFNNNGDAQTSTLVSRRSTSNATPAELFLDGSSVRMTIAADTTWCFDILVVARRTDANDESAAYRFEGCIDRNVNTTALVGSVTKTVLAEDTAGWDADVTADDTNDALIITVTGEASKTIQWVARTRLVETTG